MVPVLKLGGSFHGSTWLAPWLAALDQQPGRLLVVPGGGPFADQVRQAQQVLGYSDPTAHRMALLAMAQFGLMLCDLAKTLEPAPTREAITALLARDRTPVWLPEALCLGRPEIPETWEVTSDSLALWLAAHLGAPALALVKQVMPAPPHDAESLAAQGLVDPAFPRFMARQPVELSLFAADQPQRLEHWLAPWHPRPVAD